MDFFLFPPLPLLLSLPHFFPGRKNVGHPGAAWSPERSLGHPRHGGGRAALPWHSRPDDPEAGRRHHGARVTMQITGMGGAY